MVILRGPGLFERLMSVFEVRGVETAVSEDLAFVPLDGRAAYALDVGVDSVNVFVERSARSCSPKKLFGNGDAPRSPFAGSKTLSSSGLEDAS